MMKKHIWDWWAGSTSVDYTPLYDYFDKAVNIPESGSVYTDTARTDPAGDGDYVKSITEVLDGTNLSFTSSTAVRKSYLAQKFGSRYDLLFPVYKRPSGDKPHVFFPNMLDVQYSSSTFSAANSPNTVVVVLRSRRSVGDEGGVGMGIFARDRGQDHLEISNSAASVELDAASGIPVYQQTQVLLIEDNGSSSRAFLNNSQLGTNETLAAGSISQLFYGTTSHQWEHDLLFVGVHYGIFSSGDRSALQTLIESYFAVNSGPNAPYLHNPTIAFDGTDTFSVSAVTFNDPSSVGENTSLREYEWFAIHTSGYNSPEGYGGLDGQYPIARTATVKRSDYPNVFRAGTVAPGDGKVLLAVRIKGYDNNGSSWNGVPFRSLYATDNVAGTSPAGTLTPKYFTAASVEDANKKRIILTFGGPSTRTVDTATGLASEFTVIKNGTEISKTLTVNSGNVYLDVTDDLTYSDVINVVYVPGTLVMTTGEKVPLFATGPRVAFVNNIVGPITMKVNLSWFSDGTTPPWQNLNADGSVTTIDADVADEDGNATGIALAVTNSFQGWTTSDYGSAGTLFNETAVTARGLGVWQGGNTNGTLRFSGLDAGQTFDISYAIAKIGNGGAGNVVINGGSPIAFDSSSYAEFTETGLTADGSGNIDFTMTITGSGDEAALIGIILTTYP